MNLPKRIVHCSYTSMRPFLQDEPYDKWYDEQGKLLPDGRCNQFVCYEHRHHHIYAVLRHVWPKEADRFLKNGNTDNAPITSENAVLASSSSEILATVFMDGDLLALRGENHFDPETKPEIRRRFTRFVTYRRVEPDVYQWLGRVDPNDILDFMKGGKVPFCAEERDRPHFKAVFCSEERV